MPERGPSWEIRNNQFHDVVLALILAGSARAQRFHRLLYGIVSGFATDSTDSSGISVKKRRE